MNLASVYFVDVFDLAASLPRRLGLFRTTDDATRVIQVRGPRKDTTEDAGDFAWYAASNRPELRKWPELRNQIEGVRAIAASRFGPCEVGRVWLEMLAPGKVLPWSEPMAGPYADRIVRLHLPVRSGPAATLFAGHEALRSIAGDVVLVNHKVPNSAANFNRAPRIHLIMDLMKKEPESGLDGNGDESAS